jgi:hypothetical protein
MTDIPTVTELTVRAYHQLGRLALPIEDRTELYAALIVLQVIDEGAGTTAEHDHVAPFLLLRDFPRDTLHVSELVPMAVAIGLRIAAEAASYTHDPLIGADQLVRSAQLHVLSLLEPLEAT